MQDDETPAEVSPDELNGNSGFMELPGNISDDVIKQDIIYGESVPHPASFPQSEIQDRPKFDSLIASGKMINNPFPAPDGVDLSHIAVPLRPFAVDIDRVFPDSANVNFHDENSINAIVNMFQKMGQYHACIARLKDSVIIVGNGRYTAAKKLGWKYLAVYFADLNAVEAAALAIGDNRSAQFSEFDKVSLGLQLDAIAEEGFSLASIGFSEADVLGLHDEIATERLENAAAKTGDSTGSDSGETKEQARTGFDFVVPLSEWEDKIVKDALKTAKVDFDVPSNSAALAGICKVYLETKGKA